MAFSQASVHELVLHLGVVVDDLRRDHVEHALDSPNILGQVLQVPEPDPSEAQYNDKQPNNEENGRDYLCLDVGLLVRLGEVVHDVTVRVSGVLDVSFWLP